MTRVFALRMWARRDWLRFGFLGFELCALIVMEATTSGTDFGAKILYGVIFGGLTLHHSLDTWRSWRAFEHAHVASSAIGLSLRISGSIVPAGLRGRYLREWRHGADEVRHLDGAFAGWRFRVATVPAALSIRTLYWFATGLVVTEQYFAVIERQRQVERVSRVLRRTFWLVPVVVVLCLVFNSPMPLTLCAFVISVLANFATEE